MMLVRKEEMSDLESIDVDPSFNKKRNENSFTLFYDLDLPTHLSYSADSFVSAPEPLINETGVSVQAVSSGARVEITESETRSMFANTTVIDDKSFVNPVTQSPLCPTAQEIASIMTAKTADSRHGLPTSEIVTADCTTAAEIVTPKLACPKQQEKVAQDADESLVEPNEDLLTAVKQLSAGACSYDNLVNVLTAYCISEEDLHTAFATQSFTDVRTAVGKESELDLDRTQMETTEIGGD